MKRLGLISVITGLLLVSAASFSFAQSTAPDQKGNTGDNSASQPSNNSQNAPDPAAEAAAKAAADKAAADQMAAAQAARDTEAAKTQPLMAEGLDLNGTPRRFAPRNTVE
jgi:hypothetical protein